MSLLPTPRIRTLSKQPSPRRRHNAGMSLRFVRSPVAPKITTTQGSACGRLGCSIGCAFASTNTDDIFFCVNCRLLFVILFHVAAKLKPHCRQNFVCEIGLASRTETLEQRGAQH